MVVTPGLTGVPVFAGRGVGDCHVAAGRRRGDFHPRTCPRTHSAGIVGAHLVGRALFGGALLQAPAIKQANTTAQLMLRMPFIETSEFAFEKSLRFQAQ